MRLEFSAFNAFGRERVMTPTAPRFSVAMHCHSVPAAAAGNCKTTKHAMIGFRGGLTFSWDPDAHLPLSHRIEAAQGTAARRPRDRSILTVAGGWQRRKTSMPKRPGSCTKLVATHPASTARYKSILVVYWQTRIFLRSVFSFRVCSCVCFVATIRSLNPFHRSRVALHCWVLIASVAIGFLALRCIVRRLPALAVSANT